MKHRVLMPSFVCTGTNTVCARALKNLLPVHYVTCIYRVVADSFRYSCLRANLKPDSLAYVLYLHRRLYSWRGRIR